MPRSRAVRRARACFGPGGVGVRAAESREAPATISSARPISTAARGICSPTRSRIRESKSASSIRSTRENFLRATDDRTRAYYAESLPNPKLTVFPIAEVAAIGRPLGIPLIVDNTAAPFLLRPLEHGAAIVVYSTTKYLGGHGNSIGGAHHRRRQFRLGRRIRNGSRRSIRPIRAITAPSGRKR